MGGQCLTPHKIGRVALLEVGAKPDGERIVSEVASLVGTRFEEDITTSPEIAAWNLGRGESQVLALAGTYPGSRAVLDDLEARRYAQSLGLSRCVQSAKA